VAERLLAGRAGADLQVHQRQLLAHVLADVPDLVGHAHHGLVQAETGLHADHHQVERVRQRLLDVLLPRLDLLVEVEGGGDVAGHPRTATPRT
jgi:hypothetical protein